MQLLFRGCMFLSAPVRIDINLNINLHTFYIMEKLVHLGVSFKIIKKILLLKVL